MIGRVFQPSGSFGRACQYVTADLERARVLYQEGVRGHDPVLMARDFEMQAQMREGIGKPVFHAVLTFHRDENVDDAKKVELGLKYLDAVGMENTQRMIVAHSDARHEHIHLLANRIDNEGKPIHNFPEILKGRDTVEQLNEEYGLVPVSTKNLRKTNFEALDRSDIRKYAVYRTIKTVLPQVNSLDELQQRLRAEGIEMRYRVDEAGEREGVSYLYRNEAFRGSEIDKELSLGGLERAIAQRQELRQWEEQKRVIGMQIRQTEEQVLREREAVRQQEVLKQQEEQRLRQGPRLRIH